MKRLLKILKNESGYHPPAHVLIVAILGLFVAIVLPQVLSGNWSRAVIMVIIVIIIGVFFTKL
jgi:hypothetical protein